jgi:hypothetical protein
MQRSRFFSRNMLVLVVIIVLLLVIQVAGPVKADEPNDGRINRIPWVNSHGAFAVYCVDQFDHPGASFTGGGIKILSSTGQKLFFAKESIITPAQIQADKIHGSVLILASGIFRLYALPNGYFVLHTSPDKEAKTFLGQWKACIPVSPPQATQEALTCVPTKETIESCEAEFDNDCDGLVGFTNFQLQIPGDPDCDALLS